MWTGSLHAVSSWLLLLTTPTANAFFTVTVNQGCRQLLSNRCLVHYASSISEDQPGSTQTSNNNIRQPDMKAFASGYKTVFEELPFQLCSPSVGTVPADLKGTYYKAGPGMFSAGSIVPPKTFIVKPKQPPVPDGQDPNRMVQHPYEGDGAVLGVTFSEDSSVIARYRFVRTVAFTNERKKGAKMYTGMESTRALGPSAGAGLGNDLPLPAFMHHLQAGLNKNRKNNSNQRAIYWGKRLMSLWEGGLPYKLDARSLQTEGRSQLGGAVLKETDPFGGKMVVSGDRALFYGVQHELLGNSKLTVYEFNDAFRLVDRQTVDVPGFALVTDFAASQHYAIFVTPAVTAKGNLLLGSKAPGDALSLDANSGATLTLVPRVGSKYSMMSIPVPVDSAPDANLQFINAYETENSVTIDVIRSDGSSNTESRPLRWPWGATLEEYQKGASKKSLWRYVVDLTSGAVSKRMVSDTHCFFGIVNPETSTKRHQYVFMNIGGLGSEVAPPQGIARVDMDSGKMESWMPEAYEFCGEPMYARRDNPDSVAEDSGYILSVLYNGKRTESELLVFEASNISTGPITRIPLGIAIPHGLFGCFAGGEDARWTAEEVSRRAKLTDKVESRGNRWNEVKSDFSGLGLRFDDMEEYFGDFFS